MESLFGCVMMAAVSLPISFLVAKTCLRGVVRIVTGPRSRHML